MRGSSKSRCSPFSLRTASGTRKNLPKSTSRDPQTPENASQSDQGALKRAPGASSKQPRSVPRGALGVHKASWSGLGGLWTSFWRFGDLFLLDFLSSRANLGPSCESYHLGPGTGNRIPLRKNKKGNKDTRARRDVRSTLNPPPPACRGESVWNPGLTSSISSPRGPAHHAGQYELSGPFAFGHSKTPS